MEKITSKNTNRA